MVSIIFCILQLGNLLQLGCVTFAPDSPEVIALVEYLSNSTEVRQASPQHMLLEEIGRVLAAVCLNIKCL